MKLTEQELTDQMWSSRNEDGKHLTASCAYRGDIQTQEVDDEITNIQVKMQQDFVQWIPNHIKSSIDEVPPNDMTMSGTFVANTTAPKGRRL